MGSKIKWNFTKFLVNSQGEVIYRFSPTVQPEKIAPFIETLLNKKV
jgi:glutathione peroxidase